MGNSASVLQDSFVFSQSSLQDYDDCPRRFELRYLRRCRWPAPTTKDALLWEQVTARGFAFHRLLRQSSSGMSGDVLERVAAADPDLLRWWHAYHEQPPTDVPDEFTRSEATLHARIATYRIEARYDLLTGNPGQRWLILDWKTNAHRSERVWLEKRLQSRVYPWVLATAGQQLNGGKPIQPEQVQMCYWFAEFPSQPERFSYSTERYESDERTLNGLIAEISGRAGQMRSAPDERADAFPKTEKHALCRFCVYRSLCWDSSEAGMLAEMADIESETFAPLDVDLDTLTPIPF